MGLSLFLGCANSDMVRKKASYSQEQVVQRIIESELLKQGNVCNHSLLVRIDEACLPMEFDSLDISPIMEIIDTWNYVKLDVIDNKKASLYDTISARVSCKDTNYTDRYEYWWFSFSVNNTKCINSSDIYIGYSVVRPLDSNVFYFLKADL